MKKKIYMIIPRDIQTILMLILTNIVFTKIRKMSKMSKVIFKCLTFFFFWKQYVNLKSKNIKLYNINAKFN